MKPDTNQVNGKVHSKARQRLTLLAVVAVFVLPIGLAWWLVSARPPALTEELVNRGRLLTPPIDVRAEPALEALATVPLAAGEWALLTVGEGACEGPCAVALARAQDVRTVLGQGATRVRVVAVTDRPPASGPGVIAIADPALRGALGAALRARGPGLGPSGMLLLDWRGQVAMHFPLDAPPGDVKKDLGRLLRASKVR